jgi:hypothetical protein
MDATPIILDTAIPLDAAFPAADEHVADTIGRRWTALHEAAAIVAVLAGVPAAPPTEELHDFPAALRGAPGWWREMAAQGVEDLAAIMEPGLAALIAVQSGGRDPTAPANALLQEFVAARDALMGLALPRG